MAARAKHPSGPRRRRSSQSLRPVKFIGETPIIRTLVARVRRVAATDLSVLITGESGTGKELIARQLHLLGARRSKPFVPLNCAALPDTLLEAELFGHVTGAFTGANSDREGRFIAADGGTLFLDEIGEISLSSQAKLLRVIQEGLIQPVGSDDLVPVDVRLICATHRDLGSMKRAGGFREDLFYRIKVVELRTPALRDHPDDVPLFIEHFVKAASLDEIRQFTPEAYGRLLSYDYPGNVRELEHAIQHALALAPGAVLDVDDLPLEIGHPDQSQALPSAIVPLKAAVMAFEKSHIEKTLRDCEGNRSQAASQLQISRKNLWEKMRRHGLD